LAAIILGGSILYWRKASVRVTSLGFLALLAVIAIAPGAPANPEALRAEYLRSLSAYEGMVYIWGGEGSTGIDCSGLLRASMIDTLLRKGILEANPALLREGAKLWWRDGSAQQMGNGYGGRMKLVTETRSINELDHSLLQPGDVAVTEMGNHVMAYLGDMRWIEADPGPMKVVVVRAPGNLPWFNIGMKILRWNSLELP
jgi:cell wall-associated NlpC family hydrolase